MRATTAAAWTALVLVVQAGQQPRNERPQFRTGVDVVQVDVSVLDSDRKPVRGLTADDFTILEDGRPRPIVAFTAVDLPTSPPPPTEWIRDVPADAVTNVMPPEGRLVVILLDRTIRPPSQPLGRRIAGAAIDALGPNDLAAVIHSGRGEPQNFTTDRGLLRAAVNRPFVSLFEGDPGNPGECFCGICSLDTIRHVADSLRDVSQRRKTLLFIGDDVGIVDWKYDVPNVDCWFPIRDARNKLTASVRAANLTVHAVDPRGLETGTIDAGTPVTAGKAMNEALKLRESLRTRLDNLRVLADHGNGRAVLNTNAPGDTMAALLDETSFYYLLGFQSASSNRSSRSRRIEVKVKRADVTVQSRQAHGGGSGGASERVPPATNLTDPEYAVKGMLPVTGLDLTVAAASFAVPGKKGGAVLVTIGVRERNRDSDASSSRKSEEVQIYAGAFDRDGRSVSSQRLSMKLQLRSPQDTLEYDAAARLDLPPGRYEVRVGARHAQAGRAGSVYTVVDVPDSREIALWMSGIVFERSGRVLVTPPGVHEGLLPVEPTATRGFAGDERVTAHVRLTQGRRRPVASVKLNARVVSAANETVLEETADLDDGSFGEKRSVRWQVKLPLERLTPGAYLLTIEATGEGKAQARRDVRFEVR